MRIRIAARLALALLLTAGIASADGEDDDDGDEAAAIAARRLWEESGGTSTGGATGTAGSTSVGGATAGVRGRVPGVGSGRPVPPIAAEGMGGGGGGGGGDDKCRNFIGCPMKCSSGDKKKEETAGSSASFELGGPGFWFSGLLLARLWPRRRRRR